MALRITGDCFISYILYWLLQLVGPAACLFVIAHLSRPEGHSKAAYRSHKTLYHYHIKPIKNKVKVKVKK